MPNQFVVEWLQMSEYPMYEVSNTGRFRYLEFGLEVVLTSLGVGILKRRRGLGCDQVCAWTMANRYFCNNRRTKIIAAASCLAGSP